MENGWRMELREIVNERVRVTRAEKENAAFEDFLDRVAVPALEEVAGEFASIPSREAKVRRAPASATLQVTADNVDEISFRILKHYAVDGILPCAEVRVNRGAHTAKYETLLRGDQHTIADVTGDDVIAKFIHYYRLVKNSGTGAGAPAGT